MSKVVAVSVPGHDLTQAQFEEALEALDQHDLKLQEIQARADRIKKLLTKRYRRRLENQEAELAGLEAKIRDYVLRHPKQFATAQKYGGLTVGYFKTPPKVDVAKSTVQRVINYLMKRVYVRIKGSARYAKFIRVKVELDLRAMHKFAKVAMTIPGVRFAQWDQLCVRFGNDRAARVLSEKKLKVTAEQLDRAA